MIRASGAPSLGTAPIGANGQAVLTVTSIGPGVHSITASYSGDPIFPATSSNAVSVTDRRVAHPSGRKQQYDHPARHHGGVYAPGAAAGCDDVPVQRELHGKRPAGGRYRDLHSNDAAAGGPTTNITMTVKTATTALNAPPPSPVRSACRSPWDFCSSLRIQGRCEGGCGRFPHSWEWRCWRRSA